MSTYQVSSESGPPGGAGVGSRVLRAGRDGGAAGVLGVALLLLVLYAALAHGAVQSATSPRSPDEPRLQVAVAAVAAVALGVCLWGGTLRFAAPRLATLGVVLLATFTAWSGISLAWSVAPDGTWLELNRYLTYTIVLVLAIILGASMRRSTELVSAGFLAIVALVTAYALGQKLVPALRIPGVFSLDQTGAIPRLQAPFGYWNALALFLSMAVPLVLATCVDRTRPARLRVAGVVALTLVFLTIGFTYSRGGLVALLVGVAVAVTIGGVRLRGLLWLAVAAVAAVPGLVFGLVSHSLTTANIGLSQRSAAGAELAAVVAICVVALMTASGRILELEGAVQISPARARGIARALIAALGVGVVIALAVIALSHRGLTGTVSHAWHSFTASRGVNSTNPNNLLSADSGNRWVWWKEAAGAFSSRPLGGWGAGSFPVVHLLYRRNDLGVQQPHSVPLQYLAETGVIGAVLAVGAFLALATAAVSTVRRRPPGTERIVAAAMLGAVIAYLVHACYDWDSDIPGVTLPMLLFVGVLIGAGRAAPPRRIRAREAAAGQLPTRLPGHGPGTPGPIVRVVAIVTVATAMCAFALSAVLPSLAAGKANNALLAAAAGTPRALREADQQAILATRLDPFSDAGLLAQATVALDRGALATARTLDIRALKRDPSDAAAWGALAFVEVQGHQLAAAIHAAQQEVALDPQGPQTIAFAGGIAEGASAQQALPQDSPTNVATPHLGAP